MSRYALLIGNSEYDDDRLAHLKAPQVDVHVLAELFRDPEIGKFDLVQELINPDYLDARKAIVDFFDKKLPGDLVLFYFSGHGILDFKNRLYLAVKNTLSDKPRSEGLDDSFIKQEMGECRAKQQVLLLDCCFSGVFLEGMKSVNLGAKVLTSNTYIDGQGQVILTASTNSQYAWDGNQILGDGQNSLFTRYVIEGLQNGAADINRDGVITPDDLYGYVYPRVAEVTPNQTPMIGGQRKGEIELAYNPHAFAEKFLPPKLLQDCANPDYHIRQSVVLRLKNFLQDTNPDVAQAARAQLEILAGDDSKLVSGEASGLLDEERRQRDIEQAYRQRETKEQTRLESDLSAISAKIPKQQEAEEQRPSILALPQDISTSIEQIHPVLIRLRNQHNTRQRQIEIFDGLVKDVSVYLKPFAVICRRDLMGIEQTNDEINSPIQTLAHEWLDKVLPTPNKAHQPIKHERPRIEAVCRPSGALSTELQGKTDIIYYGMIDIKLYEGGDILFWPMHILEKRLYQTPQKAKSEYNVVWEKSQTVSIMSTQYEVAIHNLLNSWGDEFRGAIKLFVDFIENSSS
jgi:hypothetical protein